MVLQTPLRPHSPFTRHFIQWQRGETMSMPKVPDITPEFELERYEAITLLLTSIAMEEMGLAHILNAEGGKSSVLVRAEK